MFEELELNKSCKDCSKVIFATHIRYFYLNDSCISVQEIKEKDCNNVETYRYVVENGSGLLVPVTDLYPTFSESEIYDKCKETQIITKEICVLLTNSQICNLAFLYEIREVENGALISSFVETTDGSPFQEPYTIIKCECDCNYTYVPPVPPTAFPNDFVGNKGVATINILANDLLGDGSPATPATATAVLTTMGLPSGSTVSGNTVTVPNEGVWVYNPSTGEVTFTPDVNLVGEPTPLTYTLTELSTNLTDIATVVINYVPVATNDTVNITNVTQPTTLNVLANDTTGDVIVPSSLLFSTVGVPGSILSVDGKTLTVPGQGVWTLDNSGNVTFTPESGFVGSPTPVTYVGVDNEGYGTSATITLIAPTNPPIANDNTVSGATLGQATTVSILGNDTNSLGVTATTSNVTVALTTTGLPVGSTLSGNTVTVPNEGTWTYNPTTGELTFTPQVGFTGDPTPLTYSITDNTTGLSDSALVTIDYTQAPVVTSSGSLSWDHNNNNGTSYAGVDNSNCATTPLDISFGPGLTLLNNSAQPATIPNGSTWEHILSGVNTTTYAAAKLANDYVEVGFTITGNSAITNITHGAIPTAWGGAAAGGYKVAAEISNDNFATFTTLFQDTILPIPTSGYVVNSNNVTYNMSAGTYKVRFYLYDETNNAQMANGTPLPNGTVVFDDLTININCY